MLALLLGVAGHRSIVMAQSSGTFTTTGSMSTARSGHQATLLSSGKVLITGGTTSSAGYAVPVATAELYDPKTQTFTPTADMTTARSGHTATVLPNGNILIAGGMFLDSAELYDPSAGIFRATGNLSAARRAHTATLLNNGEVLIAGGYGGDPSLHNFNSAQVYDPASETFAARGDMITAREGHTATLLSDGKVLIAGGYVQDGSHPDNEIYDPGSGTFSVTGSDAGNTIAATANLLTNSKVLLTLEYSCDPSDGAEVYDPSNGVFTATGSMTATRGDRTATLLPDRTVLIAGGGDSNLPAGIIYTVDRASGAELYNPEAGTFSPTGDMTVGRIGHSATLLNDGTVLIAGGTGWSGGNPLFLQGGYSTLASAELYHPAALVPAPTLFSLSGGQGAILHAGTHQAVSSSNAAVAGEALEIYGAGLIDGSTIPPQVAIGDLMAEFCFLGMLPASWG